MSFECKWCSAKKITLVEDLFLVEHCFHKHHIFTRHLTEINEDISESKEMIHAINSHSNHIYVKLNIYDMDSYFMNIILFLPYIIAFTRIVTIIHGKFMTITRVNKNIQALKETQGDYVFWDW